MEQAYGAEKDELLTEPLAMLSSDQVVRLTINWFLIHGRNKQKLEVRLFGPDKHEVYKTVLYNYKGAIQVLKVYERQTLTNEILYLWKPTATYKNLTLSEIKLSMEHADAAQLHRNGVLEETLSTY